MKRYILKKKLINEDLGVSREVQKETKNLLNNINKIIQHKNLYTTYYLNDIKDSLVYGISINFKTVLFDNLFVKIILQVYFCKDKNDYAYLSNPMRFCFDAENNKMLIRFPIIDEKLDFNNDIDIAKKLNNISGILSHELKHAYQKTMTLKNTGRERIISHRKENVYNNAQKYLYSIKMDINDFLTRIIYGVYFSYPQEITANLEKLYTTITNKSNNINDARKIVLESELFNYVEYLEKDLYTLKNNNIDDDTKNKIQSILNRDIDWVIRHFDKGIKFIDKKLRQLERLIRQEYNE